MAGAYILATGCETPDAEFPSLSALAREIVRRRDALGEADIRLTSGRLARGELPGGAMCTVRLDDGADDGRGTLMGYALLPVTADGTFFTRPLMAAILVETALGEKEGGVMDTAARFTEAQQKHLLRLLRLRAFGRETGCNIHDHGMQGSSPMVFGKLHDMFLVDKRARRRQPGGSQATEYWLTPAGRAKAIDLASDT